MFCCLYRLKDGKGLKSKLTLSTREQTNFTSSFPHIGHDSVVCCADLSTKIQFWAAFEVKS